MRVCVLELNCLKVLGLILVNSQGFAFWRRSGASYFVKFFLGLRSQTLLNSLGFAFKGRSEAIYFEGPRGLILMNSRGFAF